MTPLTSTSASGTGFLRYKQGGSHASSKKHSQGKAEAASGISRWNVCGCCDGPMAHGVPVVTLFPTQRAWRGKLLTSEEHEWMHSSTASIEDWDAGSAGCWPQSCETTEMSPRTLVPIASGGAPQASKMWHCGVPCTSHSSVSTRTPALLPLLPTPMMLRAAASAVPQIWNFWSISRAASRTACAVSDAATCAPDTALLTPVSTFLTVPARLVIHRGAGPTPSSWQKASQK
mmetsp:Transcript_76139/g.196145  ORF Transcript_76139/g.196145 Transcript_76139/m.196145 type:complete len:231 (-) Transcript_76139:750-1442(-)